MKYLNLILLAQSLTSSYQLARQAADKGKFQLLRIELKRQKIMKFDRHIVAEFMG